MRVHISRPGAHLALFTMLALALLAAHVDSPPAAGSAANPTSTILVQFESHASEQAIAALNASRATQQVDAIPALGIRVLRVPPGKDATSFAAQYGQNRLVRFAEVNALVAPATVPNDPVYGSQWHLPKIEAPAAWDSVTATGVLIGICDTGVLGSHPDLAPALRGDLGWNAVDGSSNWSPVAAHGTYVAGAAAAATNNATGVAGVAWGASIIPVRISNTTDGTAYVSDAVKCIQYAADNGAKAINLSYRMASYGSIDSAAKYAETRGALTLVAAGNDGADPGWTDFPSFLAVSATMSNDARPSWSNYGAYIDIAAPGNTIYSTKSDGAYGAASGTSLASPVAAGVVGLIFGANPFLTAAQAKAILLQSADDIGSVGEDAYFGAGRVNARRAVAAALGDNQPAPPPAPEPAPDTTAPAVAITSPATGATVSGTVTVAASASDNIGVSRVDFYRGTEILASRTSAPYTFSWDTTTVSDGPQALHASAQDAAGNVSTSTTVSVTVTNAPALPQPVTDTFTGSVGGAGKNAVPSRSHVVAVTLEGPMQLDLSWGGKAKLAISVLGPGGAVLTSGSAPASLEVGSGSYTIVVTAISGKANYTLNVTHR